MPRGDRWLEHWLHPGLAPRSLGWGARCGVGVLHSLVPPSAVAFGGLPPHSYFSALFKHFDDAFAWYELPVMGTTRLPQVKHCPPRAHALISSDNEPLGFRSTQTLVFCFEGLRWRFSSLGGHLERVAVSERSSVKWAWHFFAIRWKSIVKLVSRVMVWWSTWLTMVARVRDYGINCV